MNLPFVDTFMNAVTNLVGMGNDNYQKAQDRKQDWAEFQQSLMQNQRQYESSLAENQRQYNTNFDFLKSQADLQQQNYENSSQIRAADMQKAGLNPLNLVGGAEGNIPISSTSSVSAPGATSVNSNSSRSSGYHMNPIQFGLMEQALQMKHDSQERAKDRKSAENIAEINASASKYHSDLGYTAESEANDIARLKAIQENEIRKAQLEENKHQFDESLEKEVTLFNANIQHSSFLELMRQKGENARLTVKLTSDNLLRVKELYQKALSDSMNFAVAVSNLRARLQELEYAKTRDDKDRNLEATKIALDNATKMMSNITNLAGDVCKGFLVGNLSGRR